jgi:hypothetical protein
MEKENIKLNIGKNKKINILFNETVENKDILEIIKRGVQIPFDYFGIAGPINFDIELVYSREEFDKKIGHKTENWVSAHSFGDKFIIFSPSEIEKYTSHKKNEFSQIISHETSHILLKKINVNFCAWLSEGIAQYVSGQKQEEKINPENIDYFMKECLFKNSGYEKFISKQGYQISYKLVNFLAESYNKNKIIELLQIEYDFIGSSEKYFCKILDVDKKKLISLLKEVLKSF